MTRTQKQTLFLIDALGEGEHCLPITTGWETPIVLHDFVTFDRERNGCIEIFEVVAGQVLRPQPDG